MEDDRDYERVGAVRRSFVGMSGALILIPVIMSATFVVGIDDIGPRANGTRVEGILPGNNVWTVAGSPYWIESNISVPSGSTLTIEAGTSVLVNGNYDITSLGYLSIIGTESNPVTFSPNSSSVTWWSGIFESYGSFFGEHFKIIGGGLTLDHLTSPWVNGLIIETPINTPQFGNVDYLTIRDITVEHTSATGSTISIVNAKHLDLARFRISGGNISVNGVAMHVNGCANCSIMDGRIESFSNGGLYCYNTVDTVVSKLTIIGASQSISLSSCNRNQFMANEIVDATVAIGIADSNYNHVVNNTILSPNTGVSVSGPFYTTHNLIAGNLIKDAAIGIDLTYSISNPQRSDNNTAAFNIIESGAVGIRAESSHHVVRGNTIVNNGIGMLVSGSSNQAFHNRFQENTIQVQDTGVNNQWDDGYPSGGNWWSDYTCVDLYRGPNQDVPGSDGIGDTPYIIDPDSRDRYPFCTFLNSPPRHVTAYANQSSGDVVVQWEPPPIPLNGYYHIYTSATPTGFDFFMPQMSVDGSLTSWTDVGAATQPGPKYYIVRAYNTTSKAFSPTSNTAGKWTRAFQGGTQSFSLPLTAYPWVDYALPGWDDTVADFITGMKASSLSYMDLGSWQAVPGPGNPNLTLELGRGYVVVLPTQTLYTFTGLPASMISYSDSPPLPYAGFGQFESRFIRAEVTGDDITVSWTQPSGMTPMKDSYKVYYSSRRDGFFGRQGWDYYLLNGLPVIAPPSPEANVTHSGALSSGNEWYYMVVPYIDGLLQGSGSYSIGVYRKNLPGGYSSMGLPFRPYANGTYLTPSISSISGPQILGVQWFNDSREEWVARQAWMPPGMYDAELEMTMAVQIDTSFLTHLDFTGA